MGTETTPDAMIESLSAVIVGLTPAGGHVAGIGTESNYQPFEGDDWIEDQEETEETEIDRHFMFDTVNPQVVKILGGCAYDLWTGELDLVVGHQVGEFRAARARRDNDIHQIISQLIDDANKPTGVAKVRLLSSEKEEIQEGLFWITLIRFGVHYKLATRFGS